MPGRPKAPDAPMIALLASGKTYRETADELGITPATITRRMHSDEFRAKVERLRDDTFDRVANRLTMLAEDSLDVVTETLRAPGVPRSTKLRAADIALRYSLGWADLVAQEKRMAAIEAALGLDGGAR